MTVQGLGASLSPAIGGWIAQEIGYSAMFLILGSFALGSIALWLGFAPILKPACARRHGSKHRPAATASGGRAVISTTDAATWGIAALATFGVIVRPWNLPEFIWAVAGAALLVLLGLLPWPDALAAAGKGTDVYFFLIGMMLLAEVARKEGLFDWLAAQAVRRSQGSAKRLFLIVYVVGTVVTILLSNDATAVVLTPAVYAATRAAKVEPLPYLFICAFIANAASFVLPISNPANLVVFGTAHAAARGVAASFALPSSVGDRRDLSRAAADATPRARCAGRRGR